ncbi:hypothetical protein EXA21_16595 [Vibrio cincinnatiensis]|uniref:thymidylate synthase n=1 Tax=Vibrio cincinnatiensis TaxID=675 RepID=UPI001EE0A490|nr:thymidylate synthase [Vibrio cincinnatiensis]MCG3761050.1 hypothetical protein [Vibrio cincinnatiensis]MCG3764369.1 hypothetical protein [Vibrio cincinnatiensis]
MGIDIALIVAAWNAARMRDLPEMKINPEVRNIFDFVFEDFEVVNYDPLPTIKAPIAV